MPEALIFFDNNGRCIWINNQAEEMLGVNNSQVDLVPDLLGKKFGKYEKTGKDWINSYVSESGGNVESFKIERHEVIDDRQRIVGSFLSIRDTSIEENKLRKETYNATHDALTKVYNRAAYNDAIEKIDLKTSFLVIFDFDSFKEVNDTYGHEAGDKVLIKTIDVVKKHFRDEDKIYRFGGDEFAIILTNVNDKTASVIETKVNKINQELELHKDNLPTTSISAGGAYGKDAENTYELFDYADHALYKRKFSGKRGFTLFELDKKY